MASNAVTDGIFRLSHRVFRPWKNGGGETAEIVVSPPGADFDTFEWRISTAIVAASGPFSTFPNVDRVLTVLEGGAMVLTIGAQDHQFDSTSEPFYFSGDLSATAQLMDKPLLDFNVMVRRPLRAEIVRGPLDPDRQSKNPRARLGLLLEDRAGLKRLDLVDFQVAARSLVAKLAGAPVLDVHIID